MTTNNTTVFSNVNTSVVCLFNTKVLDLSPMNLTYGERLRKARKHKGLSQGELVKIYGVKQGTISKIERGDQHYSGYDAELSYALDVHPM